MSIFSALSFFLLSCGSESSESEEFKPSTMQVQTTSYPVHYIVERLTFGHDSLEFSCILPIGEDAPHWSPNAEAVLELQKSDLIVSNGAQFEPWLQKISIEEQKIVDSSKGIQLIEMEGETHSHGKEGSHSHVGVDPHTWLDPKSYLQQARNIKDALVQADQSHRGVFESGYVGLEKELTSLHQDFLNATTKLRRYQIAANHPAYNYFAKRFSLQIQNFDFDPEEVPSSKEIEEFHIYVNSVHENKKPAVLFWESVPSDTVKTSLQPKDANIILYHVVVPPLEQPADSSTYDYVRQSKENIKIFEKLVSQLDEQNK